MKSTSGFKTLLGGILLLANQGVEIGNRSGTTVRRYSSNILRWVIATALLTSLCLGTASAELLVSDNVGVSVLMYNQTTGAFEGIFIPPGSGGLITAHGIAIGPDGNIYVARSSSAINRYSPSGVFLGAFTSGASISSLTMIFGPDGNLYTGDYQSSAAIKRFNGTTGAYIDTFVAAGSGGLNFPNGMAFGPDGNFYVSSGNSNSVKRYNGTTGAYMGDFATGPNDPRGLVFGPDGNLYVSFDGIRRYNGTTGAFMDLFASGAGLDRPYGLAFGSDGNLYVANDGPHPGQVLRYNGTTGAFIDIFASGGGLGSPKYFVFMTRSLLANAGPDQTVNESAPVTLNGSQSTGATLTYQWSQLAGPPVSLNLTDPAHPTFTAPQVPVGGATLTFQLIVISGQQTSAPDTVDITVKAALTSLAVTPTNPTINLGQTQQFTATGTFSDTSTRSLIAGAWTTKAPMLTARMAPAVGVINNILYVAAGYNSNLPGHITQVEAYNAATNTWVSKNPRPSIQTGPASGVINGILYAAGGANCCVGIATLTAYDPTSDTWSTKTSMSTPRQLPVGAVINGLFYVVGGRTDTNVAISSLEVYNPSTNSWTTKASMPTARTALAGGVVSGIFYVVGGRNGTGPSLSTVEAYDPTTDSWSTKASMPTPRAHLSVEVVDGLLYAIGGSADCSPSGLCTPVATVEVYNPLTNTWATQTNLPTARNDLRTALVNGLLYTVGGYILGGATGATSLTTNEAFTPGDGLTWASSNTSIATIDANGLATGVAAGSSTIAATSGSVSGNTLLTVVSPDAIAPTTTASATPAANGAGWNNANVTVTLSALDNAGGSGVQSITYTLTGAQTGGGSVVGSSTSFTISSEGTTTVTFHARDNAGNVEADKTLIVRIDKTPPLISGLPAAGCTLWPPNHKLVSVAMVAAGDGGSGLAAAVSVTGLSNEPDNGLGDGDTVGDIVISGGSVQLRAERSGKGTGRTYTLTATVSDLAGNTTTATSGCSVPHDQRK